MATLIVRDLDDMTYARLEEQARLHRRSLEDEVRVILDDSLKLNREAVIREAAALRSSLAGRYTGDPTAEIRAERDAS